jgi:hypothetical protein
MTMTDLRDVLDSAAGDAASPTPDVVADDVRRGRRALVRQRYARAGAGLLLTGAAVVSGIALVPQLVDEPAQTQVAVPGAGGSQTDQQAGVALVPAAGQDKGAAFSAALVPAGWRVDGSDFALTIAPPGLATGPDDFVGKLVVMLSPDQTPAADARPLRVGGADGTVSAESGTTILVYTPAGGQQVVVQAPAALGWDDATLARFAESVAIGPAAQAGRG